MEAPSESVVEMNKRAVALCSPGPDSAYGIVTLPAGRSFELPGVATLRMRKQGAVCLVTLYVSLVHFSHRS